MNIEEATSFEDISDNRPLIGDCRVFYSNILLRNLAIIVTARYLCTYSEAMKGKGYGCALLKMHIEIFTNYSLST